MSIFSDAATPDAPEKRWPKYGPGFNEWNGDLAGFMAILDSARFEGFWTKDFDLKYLTIRIDTRDNGWLLFVDGKDGQKTAIDPMRVVEAIEKNRDRTGGFKIYSDRVK